MFNKKKMQQLEKDIEKLRLHVDLLDSRMPYLEHQIGALLTNCERLQKILEKVVDYQLVFASDDLQREHWEEEGYKFVGGVQDYLLLVREKSSNKKS